MAHVGQRRLAQRADRRGHLARRRRCRGGSAAGQLPLGGRRRGVPHHVGQHPPAPALGPILGEQLGHVVEERRGQREVALLVGAAVAEDHALGGTRDARVEQVALAGERVLARAQPQPAARRQLAAQLVGQERLGRGSERELVLLKAVHEHGPEAPGPDRKRVAHEHRPGGGRRPGRDARASRAARSAPRRSASRPPRRALSARARAPRPRGRRAPRPGRARARAPDTGRRAAAGPGGPAPRRDPRRFAERRALRAPRGPARPPAGAVRSPRRRTSASSRSAASGSLEPPGRAQVVEQVLGARPRGLEQRAAGQAQEPPAQRGGSQQSSPPLERGGDPVAAEHPLDQRRAALGRAAHDRDLLAGHARPEQLEHLARPAARPRPARRPPRAAPPPRRAPRGPARARTAPARGDAGRPASRARSARRAPAARARARPAGGAPRPPRPGPTGPGARARR